jgi:glycosyltransferase involved in cell wall biosynthesis
MNILMATHYFASHKGGIEIVAGRLYDELTALGQRVVWIASDASLPPDGKKNGRPVEIGAWNVVEQRFGVPFPIPSPDGLKKVWKEVESTDLVFIHDCLYLTNIFTFLFARLKKVPVVIIQHIGLVSYSNFILRALMRIANLVISRPMLRQADQMVFISETTKKYFEGVRFKRPVVTIFNGVDSNTFRPCHGDETKANLRRSFGLPCNPPLALFVGRFVEKKGLAVLKHAVGLAPGLTWVFAGWGPLDPRQWNAPNVHVFADLHGERLAQLYRSADIFVLPSTGEGFPLVVQEALAAGLPVVCGSETAGADPEATSLVSAVNLQSDHATTAKMVVETIEKVVSANSNPDLEILQRRQFALSRYSWSRAAERYLEIALSLVPSRSFTPEMRDELSASTANIDA